MEINEIEGLIKESLKRFGKEHIENNRREWDKEQFFPREIFTKLGKLGFMGMLVPKEYGGAGMGYHEYVAAITELSIWDPSIGLSLAAHNSLCTNHILMFGTVEQKKKWLPKLASGEWLGAWALTEPNAGSDVKNMLTTATKKDNEWVLNGVKSFITHGNSSNILIIIARTKKDRNNPEITAFAVERGTKGLNIGRKEDKLGMRASETTEVVIDNCCVSHNNVLGKIGSGLNQALSILDGGRISIAALSLGIAEGALKESIIYAKERSQFRKPIASFQGISFKLAEMAVKVEAAKQLIKNAIELKSKHLSITKESAIAKYYASEIAVEVASDAVQIFGGYGYTKDYPVEKYFRDAKLCTIGEGTSEIQKLVISKILLAK